MLNAPDHHREPRDRERLESDPDLGEGEEVHEDLDEDRRVADHLDVDRSELADQRDAVGARGAENEADHECADDRDRRHLEGAQKTVEKRVEVLAHELDRLEDDGGDHGVEGAERPRPGARPRPTPRNRPNREMLGRHAAR